jgi:hypothetical protein
VSRQQSTVFTRLAITPNPKLGQEYHARTQAASRVALSKTTTSTRHRLDLQTSPSSSSRSSGSSIVTHGCGSNVRTVRVSLAHSNIRHTSLTLFSVVRNQARKLLDLCRGIDTSTVVDDHGGLAQTLSVENSFRQGTLQTRQAMLQAMEDLYKRLPILLTERTNWSSNPKLAFPQTLRLTIRSVSPHNNQRLTHSKQIPIDGNRLSGKDPSDLLRHWVVPLLDLLLVSVAHKDGAMDVTRINVALTNFQDGKQSNDNSKYKECALISSPPQSIETPEGPRKRKRIDEFFAPKRKTP